MNKYYTYSTYNEITERARFYTQHLTRELGEDLRINIDSLLNEEKTVKKISDESFDEPLILML